MALGGYAAETLVMGQMSTGASSDLQRATDICRRMVTQYGMSDDMGPIYLGGDMTRCSSRATMVSRAARTARTWPRVSTRKCSAR